MNRAKFWTVSISATVVMGLLVVGAQVASKDSAKESNRNARLARLQTLLDEGKAEYRPTVFRKKIAPIEHVAGLDQTASVTVIPPVKAASVDSAKETKKTDPKKDDKKKAKDKKKKKKKKTIKGSGEAETTSPEASDEDDSANDVSAASPVGASNNSPAAAAGGAVSTNPQTAEEWFAYIQAHPDMDHVSKFIQLAQVGEVKSEIFYAVIEKMLFDNNTRMHQFAVIAAGSTQSATSFTVLSAVLSEESMEKKVRSQARVYMTQYKRIEYVRHLSSVIAMENEIAASLRALDLVEDSASKFKNELSGASETASAANETGAEVTRTPASSATKVFSSVIASIQKATSSPNATLRTRAAQTLVTLRGLLGAQA